MRNRIFTDEEFREVLATVQTPAQYVGGEWNSVKKDPREVSLRFAFVFPDTYSVGMSHLGLQVLYHILNRESGISAERVFAPLPDMEERIRRRGWELFTLETRSPVSSFDVVGFSLQYELCYTNVLNILELSRIPALSSRRTEKHPLLVAGGPGALSPAPLADFIDAFFIGDAEDNLIPFVRQFQELKDKGTPRPEILKTLSPISDARPLVTRKHFQPLHRTG